MELFPAADEEQLTYIKEIIDESDYYIIISAGRYGAIEPQSGLSFTELEYDYALRREKPIIRLLHSDPFNDLRGEFIEKEDIGRRKLMAFRQKLKDGRLVRFWSEPKELGAEVIHGIEDAKKRRPAPGWVRADKKSASYDELRDTVINMGSALRAGTDIFLDRFPYPVFRVNRHLEIVYVNAAAKNKLDGYLGIGSKLDEALSGTTEALSRFVTSDGHGKYFRDSLVTDFNGLQKHFEVYLSRLEDIEGSVLAVLNDLTEYRELEGQIVQSQKMQAIGQLAGGVAHDFNNLLTAISGHCDLLLLRHEKSNPDYLDLVQIQKNSNRAAALVSQLLAFSRKQSLRPEVLSINDLMADLSHLLNRLVGEKVEITQKSERLLFARADRRQFEQVLMNLIVNSRDAMPNGGKIEIDAKGLNIETGKRVGRATIPNGRYVSVQVIDEGIGIPLENLDKVFEPFFTTKKEGEGTGLGLSTAYGIVKQSGGYIFVESEAHKGATFEILLPQVDEDADEATPERIVPESSAKVSIQGTLILSEDESSVRAFAARALRLRGFKVLEAADGTEALSIFKDNLQSINGLVTDVYMPHMDGPTWVAEALQLRPSLPVLFISGYGKEDFWGRIEHLANFRFLSKPFSLTELNNEVVRMILDSANS